MKWGRVLLLVVLAGLAACRALPPAPVIPELSAEQVFSRLQAHQRVLNAFAVRGRLTLISPQQSASGTAQIRAKFPETLRIDLKDPLGRSVFNFATDGQKVEILFPQENKLLQGPATPANLAAFIPPGVTVPQVLRLLIGDLPLSQGPPASSRFEPGEKTYVMEWRKSDGSLKERLWVAAGDFQPRKEEWFGANGTLVFSAELGEFRQESPSWPQQLKLVTPSPQVELRLAYKDFSPNPSFGPGEMVVPRPPGVVVLPLNP